MSCFLELSFRTPPAWHVVSDNPYIPQIHIGIYVALAGAPNQARSQKEWALKFLFLTCRYRAEFAIFLKRRRIEICAKHRDKFPKCILAEHNALQAVTDVFRRSASTASSLSGAERHRATSVVDNHVGAGRRSGTFDDRDGSLIYFSKRWNVLKRGKYKYVSKPLWNLCLIKRYHFARLFT